jgi:hypothetical protein
VSKFLGRLRNPGVLGGLLTLLLALFLLVPTVASADTGSGAGPLVTCYGGSVPISIHVPLSPSQGYSGNYWTSSRCADINLRIDSGGGAYFAVCWARYNTCQDHWTYVPQDGNYHVVASDVKDGTEFYFTSTTTTTPGWRSGRVAY